MSVWTIVFACLVAGGCWKVGEILMDTLIMLIRRAIYAKKHKGEF